MFIWGEYKFKPKELVEFLLFRKNFIFINIILYYIIQFIL